MSSRPTVSVVIATYNQAEYLPQAIESVLRQTYDDWELLIVNDGSTDRTEEVVAPYLRHPKIRYFKKANGGQASAKNFGVRAARGDYVAFLDSDDFWRGDKLLLQTRVLERRPSVGVVYSIITPVDEAGLTIAVDQARRFRGKVLPHLFGNNFVPFSSCVVRRHLFEKYGLFDESLGMGIDYDLWLRLSLVTEFDYIADELVSIRASSGQMSTNIDGRAYWADFIERRFQEQYPGVVTRAMLRECEFWRAYNRFRRCEKSNPTQAVAAIFRMLQLRPWSKVPYKSLARFVLFDALPLPYGRRT